MVKWLIGISCLNQSTNVVREYNILLMPVLLIKSLSCCRSFMPFAEGDDLATVPENIYFRAAV
jgi:hypothetical protein